MSQAYWLVTYGSVERMVTGTRAGLRMKTKDSLGAGFIGFNVADGDGQVSVETSDNLFKQLTTQIWQYKVKKTK